jgi:hypothetical protein
LTSRESEEASGDLSDWLLGQLLKINHDVNSKGQLLELGGSVVKGKKIAGSDHEPLFEAMATLNVKSAKAEGRTKRYLNKMPLDYYCSNWNISMHHC